MEIQMAFSDNVNVIDGGKERITLCKSDSAL
jgi:hypothetical protein